jgi:RimJ/RimL family protein N-acetyltransferase
MLEGERIVLAPVRDDDRAALFAWINDRESALLSAPYRPVHERDHEAWFDAVRQRDDVVLFGIRARDDDRLLGTCQLLGIDRRSRGAELRIRLGEEGDRGRGHGSEALRLLLRHAFDDLNLRRVSLQVLATNERAIAAYRSAGFAQEGRLREAAYVDGAYVDVLLFATLRS